jgi:hypothetical protein
MGFFSWRTSDTDTSIANIYSSRQVFTVYLVAPDGRKWKETAYEGYGVFGGKDIYELVAELNGKSTRSEGISISFHDNPSGDFQIAANKGYVMPKLLLNPRLDYEDAPYPYNCERQGYFYD